MSGVPVRDPPLKQGRGGGEADPQDLFNLLRHAHIFSAVVQEILELKLLR